MQKDVIYIDTEDDITTIISKVKESTGKIVALVPPKRIGAIQSAVNLKLVHRAAEQGKKHIVVITNNQALSALAASAGIPVAKNLQSKPEMPAIDALEVDNDDIIDGNDLPGSKRGQTGGDANEPADKKESGEAVSSVLAAASNKVASGKNALAAQAAKARTKVPNFDTFRKKLFLIIGGVVLLIGFLVWAIVLAPNATIAIKATTSDSALNTKVSVGSNLTTNLQEGTIKAETKTSTADVSIAFTATGKKDVGEKATGTAKITKLTEQAYTVPAGTQIVHNDSNLVFVTATAVTVPASQACFPAFCAQSVTVGIVAAESGAKYNGASGSATAAGLTVSITNATTGGSDKTITVVQQSDVDAVSDDVVKTADSEAAKKAFIDQYSKDYTVIEQTFKVDSSGVKPSPAVGAEASDGKGTLSGKITYSIVAVPKTESDKFLTAYFAQQIDGKANQKVYDNGNSAIEFSSPTVDGDKTFVTITTNGKIGPKINEDEVKEFAKGKKLGEIKSHVESVSGVESADVQFSPFWVSSAPNDVNKIKIEFKIDG